MFKRAIFFGALAIFPMTACAAPPYDEVLQRREAKEVRAKAIEQQKNDTYEQFFKAVQENRVNEIRSLISKGVDPELTDRNGETALMVAVRAANPDVIDVLIAGGAKVNKPSVYGDTPLMIAALAGHRRIVEGLIKHGAEVNRKGWTPMHYAATGGNDEIVEILFDYLADLDARAPNGTTPLMMAVRQSYPSTVKLLIRLGADVSLRNDDGASAEDWANKGDNEEIRNTLRQAVKK